mmetsp:Transcript_21297/g.53656  ORF Transcript_21297/g.53656 Transcript_21297/m.53656 type:complete len:229 (+) Transcript_21297:792-1478(+)
MRFPPSATPTSTQLHHERGFAEKRFFSWSETHAFACQERTSCLAFRWGCCSRKLLPALLQGQAEQLSLLSNLICCCLGPASRRCYAFAVGPQVAVALALTQTRLHVHACPEVLAAQQLEAREKLLRSQSQSQVEHALAARCGSLRLPREEDEPHPFPRGVLVFLRWQIVFRGAVFVGRRLTPALLGQTRSTAVLGSAKPPPGGPLPSRAAACSFRGAAAAKAWPRSSC